MTNNGSTVERIPHAALFKLFDYIVSDRAFPLAQKREWTTAQSALAMTCSEFQSFYQKEYVDKLSISLSILIDEDEPMRITRAILSRLLSKMSRVQNLRLVIRDNPCDENAFNALERQVLTSRSSTPITKITIIGGILRGSGVFNIVTAFPLLETLDMQKCDTTPNGIHALLRNRPTSLRSLKLSVLFGTEYSMILVGDLNLTTLCMRSAALADGCVVGLMGMTTLRFLHLSHATFTNTGLQNLLTSLRFLATLTLIECNDVDDRIFSELPVLPELRHLDVIETTLQLMTERCGRDLVRAAPNLESLSISSGEGCETLSFLAPVAPKLIKLRINSFGVVADGAELFKEFSKLKYMEIRNAGPYSLDGTILNDTLHAILALPSAREIRLVRQVLPVEFCEQFGFYDGARMIHPGFDLALNDCIHINVALLATDEELSDDEEV
jgi:hypothetical protein